MFRFIVGKGVGNEIIEYLVLNEILILFFI